MATEPIDPAAARAEYEHAELAAVAADRQTLEDEAHAARIAADNETSWAAVDLGPYKRGETVIDPPAFLYREDGRALVYPGLPHVFYGESESLKSWAALFACRSALDSGLTALYFDFEGSEPSFVERARHVGIREGAIGGTLVYVRPNEPLTGGSARNAYAREDFSRVLAPVTGIVVIDGVTECYSLHGWNINAAEDAAKFQAVFRINGAATIAIDHTAKDAGRGVIGSQHKRAGLDGAEYEFRSKVRGGRGGMSLAEVRVTKDRHGRIREWADNDIIGHLEVAPDGVSLKQAPLSDLVDPRDDALERVYAFLVEHPAGSSTREVATGAKIRPERASDALSVLAVQGRARNDGTSTRHCWMAVVA